MLRFPGLRVLVVGLVFTCCLAISKPASALAIMLSDGGGSITVTDNGFGDINPLSGIITIGGAFGAFDVNVITGISDPFLGSGNKPTMDLNQVSVNSYGSSGSLTVALTDTNFWLSQPGAAVVTSYVGGTFLNGSVSASTGVDLGNQAFGSADYVANNGSFGGAAGAFSNETSASFNYAGGLFSLTQTVVLNLGAPGVASFDLQSRVTSVPEPSSAAFLMMGLGGVAAFRRRFNL
jgi:hypothetical protein